MPMRRIWNRIYGDFLMPSSLGAYGLLLESALHAGYEIVSVERFWRLIVAGKVDPTRRYLILRHDIDADPRTGAQMWEIERTMGIVSSFYFRLSTLDLDLMGSIARDGGEVSYHYEELATVAKEHRARSRESAMRRIPEAQDRFCRNLEKLRQSTGLPMRVVASHGDFVNRRVRLPNWAILIDQRTRRLAGIDLEVYDDAFVRHVSSRHTDTDHPRHWTPGDLAASLDARLPIVYALVHPGNWQARPFENARDDAKRLKEGLLFRLPSPSGSRPSRPRELTVGARPPEADVSGRHGSAAGVHADRSDMPPTPAASDVTPSSQVERALLLIRAPASYESERRYVLDVVLGEWLGMDYRLTFHDEPGVSISLQGDARRTALDLPDVLFATLDADWLTERPMPSPPLPRMSIGPRWLDTRDGTCVHVAGDPQALPLLFAEPGSQTDLLRTTSTGVACAADIFGSVFYLLSGYEEVARPFRDEHERYPGHASIAVTEGFLERPIVDEYVDALWMAMHHLWPALTRPSPAFRLRLTHDVDQPWATLGQPITGVVHSLAGDLVRRHDPVLALRRARSLLAARAGRIDGDPYNTFDLLMDAGEQHGLRSTFYFLAGGTVDGVDGRYRLSDPPIRHLLKRIHERGHEVGLHASYGTYQSAELVQAEFSALRAACAAVGFDQPQWGVRQHYLRFENPTTWRNHDSAGFEHDSTFGFADAAGFRAGTGREYPLYDLVERRALRLRERPILVMDATLFGYLELHPAEAASRARAIVNACRRHGTDAVICYHNNSLAGSRGRKHYRDLVDDLLGSPR